MHPVHEARAHEHKHAEAHLKRAGYKRGGAVAEDNERDKKLVRRGIRQHEEHDHKGEKLTDLKLRKGGKVEGKHTKARHDRRARGGHIRHRDDGGAVDAAKNNLSNDAYQQLMNGTASAAVQNNAASMLKPPQQQGPSGQKRGGHVGRKYADGGHVKGHGKGASKVNIVIATGGGQGERQQAMQQGMQIGARLAGGAGGPPPAPPPRPPMAGLPPGPPPGAMPPPGMGGPPGMGAPPPGMPPRPPMKRGGRTKMHVEYSEGVQRKHGGRTPKRQYGGYTPGGGQAQRVPLNMSGSMSVPMMGGARPGMGAASRPGMMPGSVNSGGPMMGAPQPAGGAAMGGPSGAATMGTPLRTPIAGPGMRRGGAFALKDAGSGGAKGRMEKEKAYGHGGATHVKVKSHMRRKAGGRIERDCD